jgi:cysteinyl-tRNA synthetase
LTIRRTLESIDYRVLRYFFISSHYRTTIDYSEQSVAHATGAVSRLDEFTASIDPAYDDVEHLPDIEAARTAIIEALDDDFGTPRAMAILFDFVRAQNLKGRSGLQCAAFMAELNGFFDFFRFQGEELDSELQSLMEERERCRAARDFARADVIRDQLLARGIQLYDTPTGVRWRQVSRENGARDH